MILNLSKDDKILTQYVRVHLKGYISKINSFFFQIIHIRILIFYSRIKYFINHIMHYVILHAQGITADLRVFHFNLHYNYFNIFFSPNSP